MSRPEIVARAEQACAQLAGSGQPVSFAAVAARTGTSRATLYRDPALRALVEEHRNRSTAASTLTGLAADVAALRTALEVVAAPGLGPE
jgi:hypothetical protein